MTPPTLRHAALLLALLPTTAHAQQSLTLHQAIAAGLANAPILRAADDQLALQQTQITAARLRPNPRLYLSSEDLGPSAAPGGFNFPNTTEDFAYLSQTIELDGKRGRRIRYAEAGTLRAQAQAELTRARLAVSIAYSYWSASAARAVVAEYQDQLSSYDRIVQYQSARVDAGAAAGVDLLRTQIERDRVQLSLAQARRDDETAAIEFARAAATPSFRTATLTDPLEAESPGVPEIPLTEAIETRLDVALARAAIPEAAANLTLQHSYAVPDLDLLGGYKRNTGLNTGYGGLQYDLPFFNRNQGGIAQAAAARQLAEDQLAYSRFEARAEIETALAAYHREQSLVQTLLPGSLDRAQRNAAIILDAYQTGGYDLLRLLDAQQVLITTRLLAIQTWSSYQRAAVALRASLGEPL